MDTATADSLTGSRVKLKSEVTALLEPLNAYEKHFEVILAGIDAATKIYGFKFEFTENPRPWDQHDRAEWVPITTNLHECLTVLASSIKAKKLPYLEIHGTDVSSGHEEDISGFVYQGFSGLINKIINEFHDEIQSSAQHISGNLQELDPEKDANLIAAFALLVGTGDNKDFMSEIKDATNWKEVDAKIFEIGKISLELPSHLRYSDQTTVPLSNAANAILAKLGIKPSPTGRTPE